MRRFCALCLIPVLFLALTGCTGNRSLRRQWDDGHDHREADAVGSSRASPVRSGHGLMSGAAASAPTAFPHAGGANARSRSRWRAPRTEPRRDTRASKARTTRPASRRTSPPGSAPSRCDPRSGGGHEAHQSHEPPRRRATARTSDSTRSTRRRHGRARTSSPAVMPYANAASIPWAMRNPYVAHPPVAHRHQQGEHRQYAERRGDERHDEPADGVEVDVLSHAYALLGLRSGRRAGTAERCRTCR